jgi:hypothetical protein
MKFRSRAMGMRLPVDSLLPGSQSDDVADEAGERPL